MSTVQRGLINAEGEIPHYGNAGILQDTLSKILYETSPSPMWFVNQNINKLFWKLWLVSLQSEHKQISKSKGEFIRSNVVYR